MTSIKVGKFTWFLSNKGHHDACLLPMLTMTNYFITINAFPQLSDLWHKPKVTAILGEEF
jgi:hypothetical protein